MSINRPLFLRKRSVSPGTALLVWALVLFAAIAAGALLAWHGVVQ